MTTIHNDNNNNNNTRQGATSMQETHHVSPCDHRIGRLRVHSSRPTATTIHNSDDRDIQRGATSMSG
jgi:hypothetical protein